MPREYTSAPPFVAQPELRLRAAITGFIGAAATIAEVKWGLPALWHHETAKTFLEATGLTIGTVAADAAALTYVAPEDQTKRKEVNRNAGHDPRYGTRKASLVAGVVGAGLMLMPQLSDWNGNNSPAAVTSTSEAPTEETDSIQTTASTAEQSTSIVVTVTQDEFMYNQGEPLRYGRCKVPLPLNRATPEQKAEYQRTLNAAGFNAGAVDGIILPGGPTSEATDRAQMAIGMPEDLAEITILDEGSCHDFDEQIPAFDGWWVEE